MARVVTAPKRPDKRGRSPHFNRPQRRTPPSTCCLARKRPLGCAALHLGFNGESMRPSKRAADALRPISLERGISCHAEGSCLVRFGGTHVLCTASVGESMPPWLKGGGKGWVTAEYGMLPSAHAERTRREAATGKQSGRTQEIQRLIGRSLRAVTDLTALGERQITLDCDVLQADGGTRTASITGAWIALHDAVAWMKARNMLKNG